MLFYRNLFYPCVFLVLSSCGDDAAAPDAKKQGQNAPPVVEGMVVKPQPISDEIEVSGTLLPSEETVLKPEISGRITMLNLPEGSRVSKGTLLVKLFDADLQAELTKLRAQLKTAKTNEERNKELLKVNGISQQEYDLLATQVATIEADIAAVNAQLSKTEIRAPFDGTIGLRNVSEGAVVAPGTALAVIRAEQQLKLDFNIPETYASQIENGMHVTFFVDGDTTAYRASVYATEQSVDEGTLNLRVRARVDKAGNRLVPGASARVSLGLGAKENALMVPTQAVIPQARFKNVIVSRNGKAEFVQVKTGIRRPSDIEVITGLQAGDTIVTTGIQFIRPGAVLKFSSVK